MRILGLNLKSDSSVAISEKDKKAIVDSLTILMQRHEQLLAERYQYLLDKKESDDNLLTKGSLIVGIVISVLGFFGFKSFHSIEERAENVAKDETISYLNNNLRERLTETIRANFIQGITDSAFVSVRDRVMPEFRNSFRNDLDEINQRLENIENNHGINYRRAEADGVESDTSTVDNSTNAGTQMEHTQNSNDQEETNPFEEGAAV